jgi:hypothetical protein
MYLGLLGIVGVGFAQINEFDSELIQAVEVIRGVGHAITADIKKSQIF